MENEFLRNGKVLIGFEKVYNINDVVINNNGEFTAKITKFNMTLRLEKDFNIEFKNKKLIGCNITENVPNIKNRVKGTYKEIEE